MTTVPIGVSPIVFSFLVQLSEPELCRSNVHDLRVGGASHQKLRAMAPAVHIAARIVFPPISFDEHPKLAVLVTPVQHPDLDIRGDLPGVAPFVFRHTVSSQRLTINSVAANVPSATVSIPPAFLLDGARALRKLPHANAGS